ncbi:MAG: tRNA (adenosine(37)-N6)-threonylcarbamoyltransferase complex transferase subunit TsaD [Thermovirgaceae bacterium]
MQDAPGAASGDVMADVFLTLGIETSCDDTGVALLEGERNVLNAALASQVEDHARWGGVIPELASRKHQEVLLPLLDGVLEEAGLNLPHQRKPDLVAVTFGPGLMGSLLVGVMAAKALAQAWDIPIVGVNHIEGHMFANAVAHESFVTPFIALVISGGHTEIYHVPRFGTYELLGKTRDDAVGECYDKVAKLLGLPYPGGPAVDTLAREGNPDAFSFPVPLSSTGNVEFSYSGLKTAVLTEIRRQEKAGKFPDLADLCASFQKAAIAALMGKLEIAANKTGTRRIAVSGGVAANSLLREMLKKRDGWEVFMPPATLCTDNAVMIAAAGYNRFTRGFADNLDLTPNPSASLSGV